MSISSIVKQFDALTRDQILALRPGSRGDMDLLKALKHFETEKKDRDRAMAVAELILRSPQVGDLDYLMLYLDLMGYYRWKRDFPAALRWAHALIAYSEQHEGDLNRANHVRDLAETYLEAGDPSTPFVPRTTAARRCETAGSGQALDTGLALFTRLAQASPGDIWNYNALGLTCLGPGCPGWRWKCWIASWRSLPKTTRSG